MARAIHEWWLSRGAQIGTTRSQTPSIYAQITQDGRIGYPAFIRTNGKVSTALYAVKKLAPFDQEEQRKEVVARITEATGLTFSDRAFEGEPGVPLATLRDSVVRNEVFAIWQSMVDQIRVGA